MVFEEKNQFEIVMNEMKRYIYITWKKIAKFINEDLLGELYYMKKRFGYYFYDEDIRIVNNRPGIYVVDDESETHDDLFLFFLVILIIVKNF